MDLYREIRKGKREVGSGLEVRLTSFDGGGFPFD